MSSFQAREIWPPGTVVDRKYIIRSTLGRGGFGTVYLANHRVLGHDYVIKRLHSQFAEDPQFIDRFVKEAQTIARLKGCRQIVEVFDVTQTEDGQLILVMEYMPGGDLASLIEKEGRLSVPDTIWYAQQIAEGLKAAHAAGFVHRDVKPQNILLGADPKIAKLADFGIVADRDGSRTTSVMRTGSEGFAAPEQWQYGGKHLDGRTDIYSLGATIYLMLTGRMPYGDLALRDWVSAIQSGPPSALRTICPSVSEELDGLVLQMLEVDREKRPRDAGEVLARLNEYSMPKPPVPRPERVETIVEPSAPPRQGRLETIVEPAAQSASASFFPSKHMARVKISAAVLGLLIAGLVWYWGPRRGWKKQNSGSRASLYSVAFPTTQSGWAVGAGGIILHTEDGGSAWNWQNSGSSFDLRSVAFPTPQSGWAVGNGGAILNTEDGGGTWKKQNSGSSADLDSVTFPTPQSGWVVGIHGIILHTEDGGGTWKSQNSGSSANLDSVAFPAPQSGWVVGEENTILHTEDGGGTWKSQNSGSSAHLNLNSVAFPTPRSGWAVGLGAILHTEDAGGTWKSQNSGNSDWLDSVAFPTPQSGWAVGGFGIILHTEDGGGTWKSQNSGVSYALDFLAFPTTQSGWAVGLNGTILHTQNGGGK